MSSKSVEVRRRAARRPPFYPSGVAAQFVTVAASVRVGLEAETLVPAVVRNSAADVIAIGWDQSLSPVRTPVVRTALEHANVPVMLVPVHERSTVGEPAPA